jgi:HSP20 family protein
MALMRWNPWSGLYGLEREMDLLMRRLNGDWPGLGASASQAWVPAVDVFDRDEDLVIRAELPGIDPEKDVEITLQEGVLTIRGERRHEARSTQNGMERIESATGLFSRSVALPEGVTEEERPSPLRERDPGSGGPRSGQAVRGQADPDQGRWPSEGPDRPGPEVLTGDRIRGVGL